MKIIGYILILAGIALCLYREDLRFGLAAMSAGMVLEGVETRAAQKK